MDEGKSALLKRELTKLEIIVGLRHALDSRYRLLCEAARADWERLFPVKDPADACVTVRITADSEPAAVRGSGFLKSRRRPQPKSSGKRLPGFVH